MAEDKRDNPYPYPTATDVAAAPGDRETKAARNVMSRNVHGIPKRGFILGQSDKSPIMLGIKELVTMVYGLLDAIDSHIAADDKEEWIRTLSGEIRAMLEDHRCPDTPPRETNVG